MLSATITCMNRSFEYDSANRLVKADAYRYIYDGEDVRIKSVYYTTETEYVYNTNAKLGQLLQRSVNGVVTKYVYGLGLIGEEKFGTFKTYHFDYRGSTSAITDIYGNITDTFSYDTYGNLLSRSGHYTDTPFMYNGRDGVMTDNNGLIYMRARYYCPELRRFINADILHGEISDSTSLNRYSYVNGNPVSFVDPFGLSKERGSLGNNKKNIWPQWLNDLVNSIEKEYNKANRTISKLGDIIFTKEFLENIDDIIISNVDADAGISIGIGFQGSIGSAQIEAISRADIISIQFHDGEIRTGHVGKSTFNLGYGLLSFGPQNDTFEKFADNIREISGTSYFDVGVSGGKAQAFAIGYHYNYSISFLGMAKDVFKFVEERW